MLDKVAPVHPSLKPLILPEVAVKMFLGAELQRTESLDWSVAFEDESLLMHESDFDTAARVAKRLKDRYRPEDSTRGRVMELMGLAHKYVCEEIFKPKAVRVLYFPALQAASAFYRCLMPCKSVEASQRVIAHTTLTRSVREALDYDVVVFQIGHDRATHGMAQRFRELGKRIVYEIDDAYDALEPSHPRHEFYQDPETRESVEAMIRMADAVTVTTPALADRLFRMAKRIQVIPNLIPVSTWPKRKNPDPERFRILWAGSASHQDDLALVAPALTRFLREFPKAQFVCFGQEAPQGIPHDQMVSLAFTEFDQYPLVLAGVAADVAIAPLVDNAFNRCKSNVKLLEYWATGYPVAASSVEPYRESLRIGEGVLVAPDHWDDALHLMLDPAFRDQCVRAGQKAVHRYDVDTQGALTEEFFASLC